MSKHRNGLKTNDFLRPHAPMRAGPASPVITAAAAAAAAAISTAMTTALHDGFDAHIYFNSIVFVLLLYLCYQ